MNLLFPLMMVISGLVLPVVAVVGVVTYVRRTRQMRDAMGDGSPNAAVLDSLDQVHIRLDAMSDRLTRLEETLRLGNVTPRQVKEAEELGKALPRKGQQSNPDHL